MNLRLIGFSALALVLSGCMTPQQRAAQMDSDFGPECRQMGHVPESGEYQRCLKILHNAEVMNSMQMMMGF